MIHMSASRASIIESLPRSVMRVHYNKKRLAQGKKLVATSQVRTDTTGSANEKAACTGCRR
jgi:hypothetical protein